MSNVRAEILAASRSRTGWQDVRQPIADRRPMIDSLRLTFEDKTSCDTRREIMSSSVTTNSVNDCKSGRKLGTKVSQIANLFQSLSPPPPKEVPLTHSNNNNNNINNNNCNYSIKSSDQKSIQTKTSSVINESKAKSNNLIPNQKSVPMKTQTISNGNSDKLKNGDSIKKPIEEPTKVNAFNGSINGSKPLKMTEKFESVVKNDTSLRTGISPQVRRTESRVSRFNNAKAIFEKMQTNVNKKSETKETEISSNEGLITEKTSVQTNHTIDSVFDHNIINNESNKVNSVETKNPNEIYNNKNRIDAKTTYSSDTNDQNDGINQKMEESNAVEFLGTTDAINRRPLNLSKSVDQIEVEESPPVPLRRSSSIATQPNAADSTRSEPLGPEIKATNTISSKVSDEKSNLITSAKKELIDKIVLEISDTHEMNNEKKDRFQDLPDLNSCDTSGIPDIVDFDECFNDVEMMTEEEAQKLLSRKSWQDLFTDEQLQTEMEGLLSANNDELELKREQNCIEDLRQSDTSILMSGETPSVQRFDNTISVSNGVNEFEEICGGEANAANDLSTTNSETSIILDDVEYHLLPDGHFYIETPGLPENSDDENEDCVSMLLCPVPPRKKSKVKFSSNPMKVYSTHSVEDYDRRNEDVDPVVASAEYELEKRIERMDVFPVEIVKGIDGLGLSIIGFVLMNFIQGSFLLMGGTLEEQNFKV